MDAQTQLFGTNRHHDSTREDEKRLTAYEETNRKQDAAILDFVRRCQNYEFGKPGWTSAELHEAFPLMLETSIRRAITNISKDEFNQNGTLVNSGKLRKGEHGRNCIVWTYKHPITNQ